MRSLTTVNRGVHPGNPVRATVGAARPPGGTDLLVASAGGHLTQLLLLSQRLQPPSGQRQWVCYNHPHPRSLLAGEDYVAGHGPSTRSVPNALRNLQLARRLLDPRRITRVISTGAGIAVPFLQVAATRGIDAHYVESATRVLGPSLSGRLLALHRQGIHLYTQSPRWAAPPWRYAGSVFDGFRPARRANRPDRLRVLVSLGTHEAYGFEALPRRVALLLRPDDEVVWQLGSTSPPVGVTLAGTVHHFLPVDHMRTWLGWADVVVAHAGTGITLSSLLAGHHPVLVPRRHHRAEHVDDHQLVTARELDRRGLATHREVDDIDRGDLLAAACLTVLPAPAAPFELD